MPRKKTVEDMVELGRRAGYVFKDTEYRGSKVKHLWGCTPHASDFMCRPNDIDQGHGCRQCSSEKISRTI